MAEDIYIVRRERIVSVGVCTGIMTKYFLPVDYATVISFRQAPKVRLLLRSKLPSRREGACITSTT